MGFLVGCQRLGVQVEFQVGTSRVDQEQAFVRERAEGIVQATRPFESVETAPVVCQLPVRFPDIAESLGVRQGKPGGGEDGCSRLMGRKGFFTPTEKQEDGTSIVQDLAEAFGHAEGPVALFCGGVRYERFFVEAHVFVATAAVLVHERGKQVGLLSRGRNLEFAPAIQGVKDDLPGVECLPIEP